MLIELIDLEARFLKSYFNDVKNYLDPTDKSLAESIIKKIERVILE